MLENKPTRYYEPEPGVWEDLELLINDAIKGCGPITRTAINRDRQPAMRLLRALEGLGTDRTVVTAVIAVLSMGPDPRQILARDPAAAAFARAVRDWAATLSVDLQ